MPRTSSHSDLAGRILAFLVFAVGVGMLAYVFMAAFRLFNAPVTGLNLPVGPNAAPPAAASIGAALSVLLRQLLLLALMTVAGSVIAGKGIHLYFGTKGWLGGVAPHSPTPPDSQTDSKPESSPEPALSKSATTGQ